MASSTTLPHPAPPPGSGGGDSQNREPEERQLLLPQQHQPPPQQRGSSPLSASASAVEKERECVHKTKTIQFLGRTTAIVLQNDNGPCPLLAICNVLSLRNNLNLSPDTTEVSQEKLLSLVAERLIDSNSNVDNKDAEYVQNQQQNIADAIDLLPRLATGIDVNIKFRRIDDFEFTRECAIFDLLDIPLYHGWIVDPQDYETANAIGSKSYNALMGELVALETCSMEDEGKTKAEEDSVDFAAATTATLGVPSPSLSKTRSFNDSPRSVPDQQNPRKGDLEEEAELLRALKLSEAEMPTIVCDSLVPNNNGEFACDGSNENTYLKEAALVDSADKSIGNPGTDSNQSALDNTNNNTISLETLPAEMSHSSLKTNQSDQFDCTTYSESGKNISLLDAVNKNDVEMLVQNEGAWAVNSTALVTEGSADTSRGGEKVDRSVSIPDIHESAEIPSGHVATEVLDSSTPNTEADLASGGAQNIDAHESLTSSVDGSEPIYEGEECILDSGTANYEDREPMYEGEVILAKRADKSVRSNDEITPQQGELVGNFLKNNASQLTFNGLFCLQDGLKERELCVFFRNNHFSTMFKYDGELYLLATDQGYINQPDLVWEKLNEVNGDTLFMTGNFKEFKVESHANDAWDEQNAMASTADYLASIDSAAQAGLDLNSDLQLAIALQQQEFEQQQQQQQRHSTQQPSVVGSSRLITGPQVPRSSAKTPSSSSSSSKPDQKSKERCVVM